jgi:hypothetical protein
MQVRDGDTLWYYNTARIRIRSIVVMRGTIILIAELTMIVLITIIIILIIHSVSRMISIGDDIPAIVYTKLHVCMYITGIHSIIMIIVHMIVRYTY